MFTYLMLRLALGRDILHYVNTFSVGIIPTLKRNTASKLHTNRLKTLRLVTLWIRICIVRIRTYLTYE